MGSLFTIFKGARFVFPLLVFGLHSFTFGAGHDLYIIDESTDIVRQLTNDTLLEGRPRWSPNGAELLYAATDSSNLHTCIYVHDLESTHARRLNNSTASEYDPDWAPDGKKIVYTSNENGGLQIFLFDRERESVACLTPDVAADIYCHSPLFIDLNSIAYLQTRKDDLRTELVIFDLKSNATRSRIPVGAKVILCDCAQDDSGALLFIKGGEKAYDIERWPTFLLAPDTSNLWPSALLFNNISQQISPDTAIAPLCGAFGDPIHHTLYMPRMLKERQVSVYEVSPDDEVKLNGSFEVGIDGLPMWLDFSGTRRQFAAVFSITPMFSSHTIAIEFRRQYMKKLQREIR